MSVNINEYWGNYYVSAWSEGAMQAFGQGLFDRGIEVDMTALVGVLTEWAFIFIWVALMILSHVMRDIFIKLMVVPVSVVLGTYLMGLGNTAINKAFGIVIIIIGVYFLFDTGMDFLRNRKEK
jgi:predicted RND superfamily exporter protein